MGWWRKLLAWLGLGGRRTKRLPPLNPQRQRKKIGPPPETLVARLERATARNHDDQIVRLAFESVRRGHPEQAEIAYERAAQIYRAHGLHRKAIAVLWALVRLRPEDPAVYELLGQAYEGAERSADAARAYGSAARGWERDGEAERARQLSARARGLLQRPARSPESLQVDPPPAKDPVDRPGSMPALSEPAPSASEDLSDEEVRSLVLEGLDLEPRGSDPAPVPVARVQTAQRLADPAEAAALDLDSPEPFVLEGLDAPDPEGPPEPGASPSGAGPMPSGAGASPSGADPSPSGAGPTPSGSGPMVWDEPAFEGAEQSEPLPELRPTDPVPGSNRAAERAGPSLGARPPASDDDGPPAELTVALSSASCESMGREGSTAGGPPLGPEDETEDRPPDGETVVLEAPTPSPAISKRPAGSKRPRGPEARELAEEAAGADPEPEPAADPTLAVQIPAANPASRKPGPGRIQDASTVYDPDGSAALKAARARAAQSRQYEAATSVATDEQVRALLERLRKGRDPSE